MSNKSSKIKAIIEAMQPPRANMDRIFIHNPKGDPTFYCEMEGTGHDVIVPSIRSVEILKQLREVE